MYEIIRNVCSGNPGQRNQQHMWIIMLITHHPVVSVRDCSLLLSDMWSISLSSSSSGNSCTGSRSSGGSSSSNSSCGGSSSSSNSSCGGSSSSSSSSVIFKKLMSIRGIGLIRLRIEIIGELL